MTIVVDSSIAASWGLPDEGSPAAAAAMLRLRHEAGIVPSLFHYELRNVLLINERRSRITAAQIDIALDFVRQLDLKDGEGGSDFDVLGYARRHVLTAYDATYLELAIRTGSTLATLDRPLARAGISEGLAVLTDVA